MYPLDDALKQVLGFTDEDLAANRAGQLSGAQGARIGQTMASARSFSTVSSIVVVIFLVVIGIVLLPTMMHSAGSSQVVPMMIGSLVIVVAVIGLLTMRNRRRMGAMASGGVQRVQGPAVTRARHVGGGDDGPGGYQYTVTIGGVRFFVSGPPVLSAFQDGRQYIAYYTGRGITAMLLAAEPVPG
jgi:hypothetical protein